MSIPKILVIGITLLLASIWTPFYIHEQFAEHFGGWFVREWWYFPFLITLMLSGIAAGWFSFMWMCIHLSNPYRR
jgi:hypothetical protein